MISVIHSFDSYILLFIKSNLHTPILDKLMIIISSLGNGGLVWIIFSIILMINKKYRKVGILAIGALILSTLLGEGLLKHLVHRIRPSASIPAINLLIHKPLSYSFPSGHTTSSFAVAGVLAKYFKKYAFSFWCLASLIAFSRLYLYVHYPTDIIAGIVLGLFCAKLILFAYQTYKLKFFNTLKVN